MSLAVGDAVPDGTLMRMGDGGPEQVFLADKLRGRKVVVFGLPGAFTRTCSSAHVPSFMRTTDQFLAKGVDEIICIAVNDPFVMHEWGEVTGGAAVGITFLADADCSFTQAIGMRFDAAAIGLFGRSRRYSMLVENGVVRLYNEEVGRGTCEISGGERLLGQI